LPGFLPRRSRRDRLLTPLYLSSLLLIGLVVVQSGLNFMLEARQQRTVDRINHSLSVERYIERLLSSAIQEQTSLRGYLITQDVITLEIYRTKARSEFQNSLEQLRILVKHDPHQRAQLEAIKTIYDVWQQGFAEPVLAGTASRTTLPAKYLFDPMRPIVRMLLAEEEQTVLAYRRQLQTLNQIKVGVDIGSVVVIVAGVIWNLWLLRQRIEQPLRQLTQAGQAWREGKFQVRLDYQSADEIGHLATVLDAMARDIRDRQAHTEQRQQQLEDLISALSHDLRTPLLATRTTLKPMLNGAFGPVNPTWKEVLEEYYQSNEYLLRLVETLLDVSRYEAVGSQNLNYARLDWPTLLNQATQPILARWEQRCPVTISMAPALPAVYGDALEIQRVVQNLLDNAIKVSPPQQAIILAVNPLGSDQVRVTVCDRGPGILPKEKARLFHRFIQGRGKSGGVGLGLYLCRQIIVAHGGNINVESHPGEGSTFWFTLPTDPSIHRFQAH
jgi:signal transduction histidine kinase